MWFVAVRRVDAVEAGGVHLERSGKLVSFDVFWHSRQDGSKTSAQGLCFESKRSLFFTTVVNGTLDINFDGESP